VSDEKAEIERLTKQLKLANEQAEHFERQWYLTVQELEEATVPNHDLINRFARAMIQKMELAEEKYGHGDSWADGNWMEECRAELRKHLDKGDPLDVALYCAFLWHHGESVGCRRLTTTDVVDGFPSDIKNKSEEALKNLANWSQENYYRE